MNVKNILIKIANKRVAEAKAWVKKYFKAASDDKVLLLLIINGINDNKLISSPIQALNHELDEMEIRVPLTKVNKNNSLAEFLKIKKKRSKTFINGVWTQ